MIRKSGKIPFPQNLWIMKAIWRGLGKNIRGKILRFIYFAKETVGKIRKRGCSAWIFMKVQWKSATV